MGQKQDFKMVNILLRPQEKELLIEVSQKHGIQLSNFIKLHALKEARKLKKNLGEEVQVKG